MDKLTWKELTAAEPRLVALLKEARAVKDNGGPSFCANKVWYRPGGLKSRLVELVGWGARDPKLRSVEAYDLAYTKVYGVLPDCRNCICF